MGIIIRKAEGKDIKTLSTLATDSFVNAYRSTLPEQELLNYCRTCFCPSALKQIIENEDVIYLTAQSAEKIIGYTHLEALPPPEMIASDKYTVEMVRLYTKIGHEGKGVGSMLLNQALSLSKKEGYELMWLKVWEGNKKAQGFYEHHGFKHCGKQEYTVECLSRPVLIMCRKID